NGKGAVPVMADLFDMLVRDGVTFQNAVFAFHGKPGTLRANGDDFGARQWRLYFAGHGHERLFPSPLSKIYFPGCDVAAGEEGWKFLEAAGSVLLRGLGGLAYGWTSLGFAMPSH